jgi:[glutamine synthetase] adenylyltransferase / [glutamine synthetase]-adenylyl-L-tyrosine phosphorylase
MTACKNPVADAPSSTSLVARLVEAPHLPPPDAAPSRLREWLTGVAPQQAAAITGLLDDPLAGRLLRGIAEFSPYLFDLVSADAARLIRLLRCDPDSHLASLIDATALAIQVASSESEVMRALRRMKSEAALLIALCDIGGVWPVMRVTEALTTLAVAAVKMALDYLLRQEAERGRLLSSDRSHPEANSGLFVFAMGKMGAGELNYSSDIDLIVFFDAEVNSLARGVEPQPFFARVTQALARLLQQRTGDGYVFRVDLRLRPDPASTQVAMSTAAALNYYEREGRTWERAAMIKARPCAGDVVAAEAMMSELAPFVWRKHLDFAALADVHDMKRQMQVYRGQNGIAVEGHNVKIGPGGIREIEFFAQTQQLIAGGRHAELRVRPTLDALEVLASSNWITRQACDELSAAYRFLRRVEHRLQMIADEQTHSLPEEAEAVERFVHFLGYQDRAAFARDFLAHLTIVQGHYAKLFEGDPTGTAKLPPIDYGAGPEDTRLLDHLTTLGFEEPVVVAQTVAHWLAGEYRAFRAEAARNAFADFVPALINGLAHAEEPDRAVVAFDRFLQALQRGGRLFSLLGQNRDLVALVALVLGAAPRLGDMLARQPQLMDGLIDPRFFGAMPDQRELSERLAATLKDASSYEEFLDRLRLFGQESLFLIGTRILSGTVSAQQASTAFADVAEGIVHTVHRLVAERFAEQHGRIKGQKTAIIAMGRLGSREMTASSDLDLILLYDFDPDQPDSDGARSLQGAHYFARFTQRLISAFTTRTNYGVLYEVDMRLRPSGRAGPLASHVASFAQYQEREAWTWEHMALTRARVISASSAAFCTRIEAIIRDALTRPRERSGIAKDVADMRRAIAQEKGEKDLWELKYAAGGLLDIDFTAQYLQLVHGAEHPDILDVSTSRVLDHAERLGVLPHAAADVLRPAARLYHDLTQILRLCVSDRFVPDSAGESLLRVMARAGDAPDFSSLEARVKETEAEVRRVFRAMVEGP